MARLPSNLHLVTRGHFRSCDRDGSHTSRCAISENPMQHANFMVLCFVEAELWPIEILYCGNRNCRPF